MAFNVKQTEMIIRMFAQTICENHDIVEISKAIREFESTFGKDILNWRYSLMEILQDNISGYTVVKILKDWK